MKDAERRGCGQARTDKLTASDTFKNTVIGGARTGDWVNVRKTTNFQSNGPVTDVTSKAMTCYQLAGGSEGAQTMNVTAGSTVGYVATASVTHPGPLSFWMAKAPAGETAATMTGEGAVWFKIYQDHPTIGASLVWPSQGKSVLDVTIPKCIPDGDYLLRVEHIGLHSASAVGGAQLYISCAQLTVSGGTATALPSGLVSIPGAYKPSDPGLVINIYYPVPKSYQPPGPEPLQC